MRNKVFFSVVGAIVFILIGCNSSNNKKVESKIDNDIDVTVEQDEVEYSDDFNKAKKVFYALPSPVETAMLLKRAGADFNVAMLNTTSNSENYTTNLLKALNFGVYGADLCYANMFQQSQTVIEYMGVTKSLADELGILNFFTKELITRLENNINNRDSTMEIITDVFVNSNDYLREEGRPETAALIIAGGWFEGLYLATILAKGAPNNNELIDRVIDQKLSLITLLSLLENYTGNSDIDKTLTWLNEVLKIYNKVDVVTTRVEPTTDSDAKITTLRAKTEIFVSDEVFSALCSKIDSVRTVIVE